MVGLNPFKYKFKNVHFNSDLLELRKKYSQHQIADSVGISQSKVSRLMSDDQYQNLEMDVFLSFCKLLDRTPFEYFEKV